MDDSLAIAHSVLGEIYAWNGQYDQAVTETQRGIALNPNSASGYNALATELNSQWKLPEALGGTPPFAYDIESAFNRVN